MARGKSKIWVEGPEVEMEMPGPAQENQVDRPFPPTVTRIYTTYKQGFDDFEKKRKRTEAKLKKRIEKEQKKRKEQKAQERAELAAAKKAERDEKRREIREEKKRLAEKLKKKRADAREARQEDAIEARQAARLARAPRPRRKPPKSSAQVAPGDDNEASDTMEEEIPDNAPIHTARPAPARRPAKRLKTGGFLDDSDTDSEPQHVLAAPASPFLRLPREIREEIYKHLLAPDADSGVRVRVCNSWAETLKGRANRSLGSQRHTSIMRTNSQIYKECAWVLYSFNEFEYRLRDPSGEDPENGKDDEMDVDDEDVHHDGDADDEDKSSASDSDDDYFEPPKAPRRPPRRRAASAAASSAVTRTRTGVAHYDTFDASVQINVRKFGHYYRKIRIRAEPGRSSPAYRAAMAQAITTFCNLGPRRAHIHTLTLEVTPQRDAEDESVVTFIDFFDPRGEVIAALRRLPCQFVRILVHTDLPNKSTGACETEIVIDMRPAASMRRAHRGEFDMWAGDLVAMKSRREAANLAQRRLLTLDKLVINGWERLEIWLDEMGQPITREDYEVQLAQAKEDDGFWD